jgi:hypothetical protein
MAITTINIDSQVLTFANLAAFPITGTVKTIYIAEDTNFQYYWDGTQYVLLGSSGGNQTLNEVLIEGNTTGGQDIFISDGDEISFDNGSRIRKGLTDAGNGGAKGVALVCSLDYELKWEAGRLYTMQQDGFTIREVSHNFTITPTANDDDTKGFVIGSRWILDDGTVYECSDATTGAAVWALIIEGTVTSVGLTMPSAFTVTNSPITSSGDIAVTGAGLTSQYIRGDGSLANFPTNGGGGSSVNYYLNGSVNQGTFGGDTYYELSKTPIIGAGTNFTRTNAQGNGYIASFITDAGDPNLLNIPAGNWHLEFYFNANSGGGSPSFYGELYKVSNTNVFTLIASGSTNPEGITQGTTVDQYFTSIPVPQTTLLATDRLAIRVYVNTGGRNITLHTEDNNLCQVITTFSTGLNALNGLTAQVQNFATGTSGTDFAISSVTDTHTFNLPTASATNRGALSSADWSTFNGKVNSGAITSSGLTMATARLLGRGTAGSGAVEEIVIGSGLTLTGTTLSAAGGGITIGTTAISSGTVNRILFEGAGNVVQQDSTFVWNNTDKRLILGTEAVADTNTRLVVIGKGTGTNNTFAVHNSTGTSNSFVVLDNGLVGVNIAPQTGVQCTISTNLATPTALLINATTNPSNLTGYILGRFNTSTNLWIAAGVTTTNHRGLMLVHDDGGNARGIYIGQGSTTIIGMNFNSLGTALASTNYTGLFSTTTPVLFNGSQVRHYFANNTIGDAGLTAYQMYANNSANTRIEIGNVVAGLTTNTAGSHSSFLRFSTAVAGTFAERMRISQTGSLLINTTTDIVSSILTLASTTKGFLPPRNADPATNITSPVEGLIAFDTTDKKLQVYDGTNWIDLH